ncbi:acyl-CoA carboxylase subunit epsilon [Streptomyces sp. SID5785]|uniref:acyl-CoA carboxylase subunit epsilon n=1 Tax=Streptomyces sp. SID5785 TaxID=2690309 RepID=UPI001361E3C5|nr:acyl-CoA carboxylase subunit epsilon [Streptomyces sp. SID5785]MZD07805.1 acyl-CoA carboxylase subunit epsilon [Streptomyces sp. SID5785]
MDSPVSLVIVRGRPTAEEVAAVTAVLLARLQVSADQAALGDAGGGGAARAGWGAGPSRRRSPVGWSHG